MFPLLNQPPVTQSSAPPPMVPSPMQPILVRCLGGSLPPMSSQTPLVPAVPVPISAPMLSERDRMYNAYEAARAVVSQALVNASAPLNLSDNAPKRLKTGTV